MAHFRTKHQRVALTFVQSVVVVNRNCFTSVVLSLNASHTSIFVFLLPLSEIMLVLQSYLLGIFENFYRFDEGLLCLFDPFFFEASHVQIMLCIKLVLHSSFVEAFF